MLNLAREYYCGNNFRAPDNEHHAIWTKKDGGQDAESLWRLVCGKIWNKMFSPKVNMKLLRGDSFYIKRLEALCKRLECKRGKYIFKEDESLINYL